MSGIDREIYLENRTSLINKHLPATEKSQRELETEGIVYLFNNRQTMERASEEIKKRGERTGAEDSEDKYERYGLFFADPIGYILKLDGSQIPFHYGEIKITRVYGEIPCHPSHQTA